jgi:hypothetical protein
VTIGSAGKAVDRIEQRIIWVSPRFFLVFVSGFLADVCVQRSIATSASGSEELLSSCNCVLQPKERLRRSSQVLAEQKRLCHCAPFWQISRTGFFFFQSFFVLVFLTSLFRQREANLNNFRAGRHDVIMLFVLAFFSHRVRRFSLLPTWLVAVSTFLASLW